MIRKHTFGLGLIAAMAIVTALAFSAAAAGGPDMRALHLRSDALNKLYGVGQVSGLPGDTSKLALRVRSQWLNARYGTAATSMSAAEFLALRARSNALNERYGLGEHARVPVTTAPGGNGFDWTTAGIAVAGALVLLSVAAVAGSRHRHLPTAHSH